MIWVDREAKKIAERKLSLEWVDDMKTPSGRVHVGSLRGVVIHDLFYKALSDIGVKSKFTYVFDDHDPMDAIPSYLDRKKWEKYAGMQLFSIPSPQAGFESFAKYYAQEFTEVFNSINCHPEIIWASQLYKSGKMNDRIKEVLDNVDAVKAVYEKTYKKKLPEDWYPFNPVCSKCQKIGTTKVYKWDGKYVYYRCEPEMVDWAKGCGNDDKISPFDGNGKLTWKVEWAAKWKTIGVTVEGAGKDHMSAGGSHDIASELCKKVFDYPVPHGFSYEFLIIGGKKMSSSKGVGSSSKEVADIVPPEILRFLMVRTPVERTIDFHPYGDTIPNLFDEYDRSLNAYFDKLENKLPEGKNGEVLADLARIAELSEVRPLPQKRIFLPRFRTVVNLEKSKTDLLAFFEDQKGTPLTSDEKEILEERSVYAQVYLKKYAITEGNKTEKISLNSKQKKLLKILSGGLKVSKKEDKDSVQTVVFNSIKESGLTPKEAFPAIYLALTGKGAGPRITDIISDLGFKDTVKKLEEF